MENQENQNQLSVLKNAYSAMTEPAKEIERLRNLPTTRFESGLLDGPMIKMFRDD